VEKLFVFSKKDSYMDNSIGNGPFTLINFMTTLQVSSFAKKQKKGFFLGSLYLATYVIHTEDPAKYFTQACKIRVSLEKRGKISFLYKGKVLNSHALKNKVGPA
jgi:hypothetical protein